MMLSCGQLRLSPPEQFTSPILSATTAGKMGFLFLILNWQVGQALELGGAPFAFLGFSKGADSEFSY
jgi:hypothetical protein